MIGELADLNARTRTTSAAIDFSASGRQTKQLVKLEGVRYSVPASSAGSGAQNGARALFSDLNFTLTAGMRVGLVGPNGSGKTTLLRLLRGEIEPSAGEIRKADGLRIVYFDQNRVLDPGLTLRRALAPDSDSVIYQDRVIHVGGWAARFLFASEDLNRPVSRLSGGERARVLIAQLMLQPADLLLLDEPTNDLDIPTLEISGGEPAGISRRAGAGDARPLHARPRVDGGAGSRWVWRLWALRELFAVGRRGRASSRKRATPPQNPRLRGRAIAARMAEAGNRKRSRVPRLPRR